MDLFIRLVIGTTNALLTVITFGMLLRAVFSLFFMDDESPIAGLLCAVTEPIILPFRKLFERMNWFQDTPVDVAYLAAYLMLMIVQVALSFAG